MSQKCRVVAFDGGGGLRGFLCEAARSASMVNDTARYVDESRVKIEFCSICWFVFGFVWTSLCFRVKKQNRALPQSGCSNSFKTLVQWSVKLTRTTPESLGKGERQQSKSVNEVNGRGTKE